MTGQVGGEKEREMGRTIAILMLVLVSPLFAQAPEEGFFVEELSGQEVKAISDADKEFAIAQQKHDALLRQVRANHGESHPSVFGTYPCGALVSKVELRGKYALITRSKEYGSCPVAASITVTP